MCYRHFWYVQGRIHINLDGFSESDTMNDLKKTPKILNTRSELSYVMDVEPDGSRRRNITLADPTSTATATSPGVAAATLHPYYQTYDVMTGVRIAATLGSFFGLMVLLVLYKSKSKTEKAMEDPDFTAAAIAEVEEEERQLQLAMEETVYYQLNPRKSRRSLDTSSVPMGWSRNSTRFSSVGGYSSLLEPPTRMGSRLPSFIDEDSPPEEMGSIYEDVYYNSHLDVPRRPSNITCSSSGSSYLERRDSAVTLGLPALPGHRCKSSRRQSSPVPETYDFYYPIDIRVTQPTPGGSPCGSDRALYDRVVDMPHLKPKLAPLASISSCNSSLGLDYPDFEVQSFASDSVFNEEDEADTENEIDEFSTDSDVNSDEGACYRSRRKAVGVTATPAVYRPPCALPPSKSSSLAPVRSQHGACPRSRRPIADDTDTPTAQRPSYGLLASKRPSSLEDGQDRELRQLSDMQTDRADKEHSWPQETLF